MPAFLIVALLCTDTALPTMAVQNIFRLPTDPGGIFAGTGITHFRENIELVFLKTRSDGAIEMSYSLSELGELVPLPATGSDNGGYLNDGPGDGTPSGIPLSYLDMGAVDKHGNFSQEFDENVAGHAISFTINNKRVPAELGRRRWSADGHIDLTAQSLINGKQVANLKLTFNGKTQKYLALPLVAPLITPALASRIYRFHLTKIRDSLAFDTIMSLSKSTLLSAEATRASTSIRISNDEHLVVFGKWRRRGVEVIYAMEASSIQNGFFEQWLFPDKIKNKPMHLALQTKNGGRSWTAFPDGDLRSPVILETLSIQNQAGPTPNDYASATKPFSSIYQGGELLRYFTQVILDPDYKKYHPYLILFDSPLKPRDEDDCPTLLQ